MIQAAQFTGAGSALQGPTGVSLADGAAAGAAFTAEFFYTPSAADILTNSYILTRNGSGSEWLIVYAPGAAGLIAEINGAHVGPGTALVAGTTYHIALTWTGTVWHLWLNGVDLGTTLTAGAPAITSSYMEISGYTPTGGPITGTVDEVRISNIARYTAGFVVPSAPFTTDANTEMLYHLDQVGGITTTVLAKGMFGNAVFSTATAICSAFETAVPMTVGALATGPLSSQLLPAGTVIESATAGIGSGDQWSGVELTVAPI